MESFVKNILKNKRREVLDELWFIATNLGTAIREPPALVERYAYERQLALKYLQKLKKSKTFLIGENDV